MWIALTATVPPRASARQGQRARARRPERTSPRRRAPLRDPRTASPAHTAPISRARSRWCSSRVNAKTLAVPVPARPGSRGAPRRRSRRGRAGRPAGCSRQAQRAVADDAGAQQRRRLARREALGQPVDPARRGDHPLGVAAVAVAARERGARAEVLAARPADRRTVRTWTRSSPRRPRRRRRSLPRPRRRAATRPAAWWPGTTGRRAETSPSTMWRSVRQTPQASTAIATSPGPGATAGTAASQRRAPPPKPRDRDASLRTEKLYSPAMKRDRRAARRLRRGPPHPRQPGLPRRRDHADRLRRPLDARARSRSRAWHRQRDPGHRRPSAWYVRWTSFARPRRCSSRGALVDLAARLVGDWQIGAAAFVVGWIFQGIGHARLRKELAGLLPNLVHLLVGPAYLVNEVLHLRPAVGASNYGARRPHLPVERPARRATISGIASTSRSVVRKFTMHGAAGSAPRPPRSKR